MQSRHEVFKKIGTELLLLLLSLVVLSIAWSGCNRIQPAVESEIRVDASEPAYLLRSTVLVEVRAVLFKNGPLKVDVSSKVGSGSGVVISADKSGTKILTAAHVCLATGKNEAEFLVENLKGDFYYAEVLWKDASADLCVLHSPERNVGPPVVVSAVEPPLGALVYYPGAPLGLYGKGVGFLEQAHFAGTTEIDPTSGGTGVRRYVYAGTTYHGASGSGIFYRGRLIGILSGVLVESGYIVVSTDLDDVVDAVNATKFLLPSSIGR